MTAYLRTVDEIGALSDVELQEAFWDADKARSEARRAFEAAARLKLTPYTEAALRLKDEILRRATERNPFKEGDEVEARLSSLARHPWKPARVVSVVGDKVVARLYRKGGDLGLREVVTYARGEDDPYDGHYIRKVKG